MTIQLGSTGMEISSVGFGAWAIGGTGWWDAWGAQDDDVSIAAIRRAAELGINWIDTAPIYGLGHSEEVVGRALDGLDPRPYVFTKAGLLDGGDNSVRHNLARDSILREVEASLRRLRLDAIDLYQVHWPIPDPDIEEAWATFAELKEQGLVHHIGTSNFSVEQLRRAQAIAPVETVQPLYSLPGARHRGRDPALLRRARHRRDRLLAEASGLLSGAMTPSGSPRSRTTIGASTTSASRSRNCRGTWRWSNGCARSARRPVRSPWRGRSTTPPSTARSSGSGGPIRSSSWRAPATSRSPTTSWLRSRRTPPRALRAQARSAPRRRSSA